MTASGGTRIDTVRGTVDSITGSEGKGKRSFRCGTIIVVFHGQRKDTTVPCAQLQDSSLIIWQERGISKQLGQSKFQIGFSLTQLSRSTRKFRHRVGMELVRRHYGHGEQMMRTLRKGYAVGRWICDFYCDGSFCSVSGSQRASDSHLFSNATRPSGCAISSSDGVRSSTTTALQS